MKFVACGSTALVEGTLIDNSSGFKPKEYSNLKSLLGVGTREVRAYAYRAGLQKSRWKRSVPQRGSVGG